MKFKISHPTSGDSDFDQDPSYQDEFWANQQKKMKPYSTEG